MLLQPPDLHYLNAAKGWCDFHDYQEACRELQQLSPRLNAHPDVLEVRWQIYINLEHDGYYTLWVANMAGEAQSLEALLEVAMPLHFESQPSQVLSNGSVFQVRLTGKMDQGFVIQGSDDLTTWVSLQTNWSSSGTTVFNDSSITNKNRRFYRAVPLN